MHISFQATVYSHNGVCGTVSAIIVQPQSRLVTHLVVCQAARQRIVERLVAMRLVSHSQADGIYLDYPQKIFAYLPKFRTTAEQTVSSLDYALWGSSLLFPDASLDVEKKMEPRCNIPSNSVALYDDTPIHATNGRFGTLTTLITEPNSDHISHLVVQHRQLWQRQQVTLPIEHVLDISKHQIRLQLNKRTAAALATERPKLRSMT